MKKTFFSYGALLQCLAFGPLLLGCMSTATVHTARPIKPKTVQLSGYLSGGQFSMEEHDSYYPNPGAFHFADSSFFTAGLGLQTRFGWHEHFDMGIRFDSTMLSTTLDFNVAIFLSDTFALSVNPTFTHPLVSAENPNAPAYYTSLPLLFDIDFHEAWTLTLGPKPILVRTHAYPDVEYYDPPDFFHINVVPGRLKTVLGIGGSCALSVEIRPGVRMMTEFSMATFFPKEYEEGQDVRATYTLVTGVSFEI